MQGGLYDPPLFFAAIIAIAYLRNMHHVILLS